MKGCHSCEHAAAIAEGKFADNAWEDIPCSECNVMTGMGFAIEFDETRPSAVAAGGDEEGDSGEEHLPVSVMQEIVVGFLKLAPELRDVVAWRYAGVKYTDIALVQGVTISCVEKRHRRAMALWPVLRSLFPEKCAKQERRRTGGAGTD
ncbi:MAG: sigma-70 region 4 domain-containing protein [Chloroflexi bacterium]|nr:sigma-70 region 4 domain-containing protein [Chloroflexota bacterium]